MREAAEKARHVVKLLSVMKVLKVEAGEDHAGVMELASTLKLSSTTRPTYTWPGATGSSSSLRTLS
ncbi:MAG: hypothetical protein DRJ69_01555 [Thermoprotei archaeon]|nr:MAG: hypothetical protein DRJ69_01555 [Thermoprotei archaeon]